MYHAVKYARGPILRNSKFISPRLYERFEHGYLLDRAIFRGRNSSVNEVYVNDAITSFILFAFVSAETEACSYLRERGN